MPIFLYIFNKCIAKKIMGAILRANLAAWLYLAQAKYLALGLNKV